MLYLGNVLLRFVLIYNLEVSFNCHFTFLQLNVIKTFTLFFLTPGYFPLAPDNSISISLEGSSYLESTVLEKVGATLRFQVLLLCLHKLPKKM